MRPWRRAARRPKKRPIPTLRASILGLLILGACQAPEPPTPTANNFAEQVEDMRTQLAPWQPWYDELARLDQAACYDDVLCQREQSQQLLWDDNAAAPLADASGLDDPEACCGALPTIVDFKRQLDQVGVDLLIVIVPPVAAIYPEHFGTSAPLEPAEPPPLLDWRLRTFYAALEKAGVEVVDLLPAFIEQRYAGPVDGDRRELIFQWQDTHWTAWGTEIASAEIARRIQRYPWFEEVAARQGRAIVEESVTWRQRHGSVVRSLIAKGLMSPDSPKERLRRIKVRIPGERWSFDDRSSPVVLLGDSFSLPRFGLPDQLLKHLGFRVDTVTVSGRFPTGGPKALSFRGDRLAGKRLVIWEITSYALIHDWRRVDVLDAVLDPTGVDNRAGAHGMADDATSTAQRELEQRIAAARSMASHRGRTLAPQPQSAAGGV